MKVIYNDSDIIPNTKVDRKFRSLKIVTFNLWKVK